MSTYYPDLETDKTLYYVEFDRGVEKGTFTLFKRQYLYSKEELEKHISELPEKDDLMIQFFRASNEVHPWNILSDRCREGGMPSPDWVKWMVDALNEKAAKDLDIKNRQK